MNGWIGVDLDGTLAFQSPAIPDGEIGHPIPGMVNRVQLWLMQGKDVRIFTARAADPLPGEINAIRTWCQMHIGSILPVTCVKDRDCREIWDDIAIQVVRNDGTRVDGRLD